MHVAILAAGTRGDLQPVLAIGDELTRRGHSVAVLSLFVDQPFWGWRLQRAGAGVTLPFRRLTADRLGNALDRVLTAPYAEYAEALGIRLRAEDGTGPAADAVERLASPAREESR